jgi:hypothetical protein
VCCTAIGWLAISPTTTGIGLKANKTGGIERTMILYFCATGNSTHTAKRRSHSAAADSVDEALAAVANFEKYLLPDTAAIVEQARAYAAFADALTVDWLDQLAKLLTWGLGYCHRRIGQRAVRRDSILENQNIEWKEMWHDEYLKWICGFANAHGGAIEIGRNNTGEVVGLTNSAKLLEELPNKIRTTMGIVTEVNLHKEKNREYIVINVNAHQNAISYRGKYYYRSGSTNQELTGYALDELILRKYGRTWDSAPVPRVRASDFYHDAFDIFRKKAVMSKRLSPNDVDVSDAELLQALKLTEGDYILRAALLLFHQDPGQWCFGSHIKIGYFENDADLLYQDEISGR